MLIENFRAGVMEKLGYTWAALHARYPTPGASRRFPASGQTGPYRNRPAYDMVVQAMGGLMSVTGEAGGNPARVGVSIGDIGAGLYATIGIQSALLKRAATGLGERVDISMLDCQVALLENPPCALLGHGRRAEAAGHAASVDHPVRHVRHPGRLHRHRRGQRCAVHDTLHGAGARGMGAGPALRHGAGPQRAPRQR